MERRHPFLELTLEQVRARLGPTVAEAVPVNAGATNTLYRIVFDDGRRALWKLYTRDGAACARETAVLRLVSGRVPVPRVLSAASDADPPHALLEWIEGTPLDAILPTATATRQAALGGAVARVLAIIHSFEAPPAAACEFDALAFVGEALDGHAGRRLGPADSLRLRAFVEREHARFDDAGSPCLVHGDFNPSNVLVQHSDEVAAVVDWEWAVPSTPLHDLGNLLRDRGWSVASFEGAVVESYQSVAGSLGDDWRLRMDLLETLSAVEFLSQEQDRPVHQDAAAARIRTTLERWS